ncbi:2-C-methyl-D-erythritol 4-phosphate cytidylyltransferase [Prevotella amnii]|jgi:2-C-methyl-D-erythritol 4-phosphate cytidylyltransferase|uniref:2-C-methyl-D-erythritol 4-phosphate cytidylyltransferase n=2 Tax=Prevotella amnii TaxID=419005 RepID=A0A134BJ00_9BACT|nr:2-C-methyl-D-erythritol 4-phosphate cytidylyltransferase [Prevotella amnii]EFN91595.1 2-C-methyl-D-erythritol 4-phosphate cytidylyltransferase [Prevotella amnii CRIS 21A-A]KXB79920.1 2-C-methyl-D-erythritol 4-phosphate cytidylyltransferase [Prevotella amnii]
MEKYAIIVAGGKGLRMGMEVPKQFLPVAGLPVLMRTIRCFREYDPQIKVILVLPKEQQEYWHDLCLKYNFSDYYELATGGSTRFQSSKNGLDLIPDAAKGYVAIHDGVRPFVSKETILRCFKAALTYKAVIPVLKVTDTLRYVSVDGSSETVPRSSYCLVQTPQVFDISVVKKAYCQDEDSRFTDDASVVESIGQRVKMVEGNRENIKLTTPFDLKIAEKLCYDK